MTTTSPHNCQDCPVWKKSLFKDFDMALLSWMAERKKLLNYKKKDELFSQGKPVQGIYCHLNGLARVVQKDENGNVRFSRLVLPGDTSGHRSLFIEKKCKGTLGVISEDFQACFIPKEDILHLLSDDASFAKNLVVKIAMELQRSEDIHISVKEKTVRGRLAQLLCELSRDFSETINDSQYLIKSEITKKEIASLLSVANETVIRLMSEMKSEGLIRYQDKRLVVLDLEQLKKTK